MSEKILKSTLLHDGRLLKFMHYDIELQNGALSAREIVKHPGGVAIVPVDAQGRVLLVRQYRLAAGRELVELPAGTLEAGEDPAFCAARELQEETGYKADHLESLGGIYLAPGYTTEFLHLFYATGLSESKLAHDADEFIDVVTATMAEALAMIEDGTICDGKSVAGLMRVARRLGV